LLLKGVYSNDRNELEHPSIVHSLINKKTMKVQANIQNVLKSKLTLGKQKTTRVVENPDESLAMDSLTERVEGHTIDGNLNQEEHNSPVDSGDRPVNSDVPSTTAN
jgi:hypothetical protein